MQNFYTGVKIDINKMCKYFNFKRQCTLKYLRKFEIR